MKVAEVRDYDFLNGDGIGVSVWVTGCPHHCYGCHNQDLWDVDPNGYECMDYIEALNKIRKCMDDPRIEKHLAILGGEPLAPYNIYEVSEICRIIKEEYPSRPIWLWTGYNMEELNTEQRSILKYVDFLITGRFEIQNKVKNRYYGSSNQKIYRL